MQSIPIFLPRGFHAGRLTLAISLAALLLCLPRATHAATLTDFGYQHMKVNGALATGSRPLLVILVNFAGEPPLTDSPASIADLIFNTNRFPSFNGYFQAMSNGRFSFSNAGVIGPLSLPASQVEANWPLNPTTFKDGLYCSNIVYQAMVSGLVNFQNFDANHDGHVTQDELAILIINQDTLWGSRPVGTVKPAGFSYDFQGNLVSVLTSPTTANVNSTIVPFVVMVEETEEQLGAIDIYGGNCLSTGLSPQSCYIPSSPLNNTYYLDPWDRMQAGWCDPRIRSLTAGGIETIPAAQTGSPSAPIILYDPAHGTNEFFILEYRTSTSPAGPGYDGQVADSGLAVWHVQQDSANNAILVPDLAGHGNDVAVWNEGPPAFQRGASTLWHSNAVSPALSWYSGGTATHFHVRPFNPGDGSITVEWLSALDSWADFNFQGFPESGTFSNPYKTMAAGINGVSYGGNLNIKTGSSSEKPAISKPMTLKAYNGPVTIGR